VTHDDLASYPDMPQAAHAQSSLLRPLLASTFAHRVCAALRAISLRRSADNFLARARPPLGPPILPPTLPRIAAASLSLLEFSVMPSV